MRYVIKVFELTAIPGHTPEGMSPFSIQIVDKEYPDDEGYMGMFAPSDLAKATNTPEECVRLASFIALSCIQIAMDKGADSQADQASRLFFELSMIEAVEDSSAVAVARLKEVGSDYNRLLRWPVGHSLVDLALLAKTELQRTSLIKVADGVRGNGEEVVAELVQPRVPKL